MLCQAERAGKAGYYVAIAVTDPLHFYFRRNKMMKGIQVNCAWMPFENLCIFEGLANAGIDIKRPLGTAFPPSLSVALLSSM